jgi:DNA-binding transcriptional LysR family regulator
VTIRHLKIFVAVCNNETLTATAESMNISQPSISQAIIQMEKYYNVKLFDRMSNKLYLTETGRKLLGYAKYITELFSEMENSMRTEIISPVIRVGSSITIGRCLLPEFIYQYRKLNPKTVINVTVQSSGLLEKKLLENSIDFALVEGPVTSPQICCVPFMDDELILVCGADYALAKVKSISINELSGLDFILREGESGSRAVFDAVMMANGIDYNVIWHSDSMEAIKRC